MRLFKKYNLIILLLIIFQMIACQTVENEIDIFNWEIAAELPPEEGQQRSIGYAGPVAGAHNGILFIGGGANFPDVMPWLGGVKKYHDELWVYKPVENKFELFRLPYTLAYSANVSTTDGVISAGGENESGIVASVLIAQWKNDKAVITQLPPLPVALTNASAAVVNNVLYVTGGETKEAASDKLFKIDMSDTAKGWQTLASLPQPTSHAVFVGNERDNKLYLAGGRKKTASGISELYATGFEYDIANNSWQQKSSLPYALCAGTGVMWKDEHLVLFGGDKGETFHKAETLIAKINAEKDPVIKEQLNQEKIKVQSTHPGFSKEVLWYNIKKDEWQIKGSLPFDVPVTTTAVQIGEKIYIPSGEIKAGVRTPAILIGETKHTH